MCKGHELSGTRFSLKTGSALRQVPSLLVSVSPAVPGGRQVGPNWVSKNKRKSKSQRKGSCGPGWGKALGDWSRSWGRRKGLRGGHRAGPTCCTRMAVAGVPVLGCRPSGQEPCCRVTDCPSWGPQGSCPIPRGPELWMVPALALSPCRHPGSAPPPSSCGQLAPLQEFQANDDGPFGFHLWEALSGQEGGREVDVRGGLEFS